MRIPRLYVDAPLTPGGEVGLSDDQTRRLGSVLRLNPGDSVAVFNARDGEFTGRLAGHAKRGFSVALGERSRPPEAGGDLVLLFAPVKRQATDWIIEKAVELGVARIIPVMTRRTIAETVRLDRWRVIAEDAASQCGRLDLPQLQAPAPLERTIAAWPHDQMLLFADEAGGRQMRQVLAEDVSFKADSPAPGLLVGPEGGFDPSERRWLLEKPFVRGFSFGARILRAETACIAGLALIDALQKRG